MFEQHVLMYCFSGVNYTIFAINILVTEICNVGLCASSSIMHKLYWKAIDLVIAVYLMQLPHGSSPLCCLA